MCFYHDDDEYCPVWKESIVVGKKEYKCESCRRKILPGEQQLSVFYVIGGKGETIRVCNQCVQDEKAIAAHERRNGCEGSEAHPYYQEVARLMIHGNEDEEYGEFDGDVGRDFGPVLFWPYGVPPAVDPIDLKARFA